MTDSVLFVGGRVFTGRRWADALLIENGQVVAVGAEASVRANAATGTERVDLGGGLVIPGLADAHLHLGELARSRYAVDAATSSSVAELARSLTEWTEAHPHGPVVGVGLDPGRLAERRWPTVRELDAIVPDRPLALYHASGHAAIVNTTARELLPPAPRPGRRPVPPGVLVEEELEALRPVTAEAQPLTPEAIETTARGLAGFGLTSVGTMNAGASEIAGLRDLDRAGRLPIRVRAYPPLQWAVDVGPTFAPESSGRFGIAGVKAFLDGAFGPRTASLEEPYADDATNRGIDRGDDRDLAAALNVARELGLTPALHAIGDRAVARAVRILSGLTGGGTLARIEHAGLTPPSLFEPLRRSGAYLVVQPGFVRSDVWLGERLGPSRARWAYAFRSLHDFGVPLAGSSDAPYDNPDPWRGLGAALHRRDELGRSANPSPDQAIPEGEALALYITGAHRALGERHEGELEPSAPADLVVLSGPRLGDAVRDGARTVRQTWVAGRRVAGASDTKERT